MDKSKVAHFLWLTVYMKLKVHRAAQISISSAVVPDTSLHCQTTDHGHRANASRGVPVPLVVIAPTHRGMARLS